MNAPWTMSSEALLHGAMPVDMDLTEAFEIEIALRTAEMVRAWELSDPRDSWRHTGAPRPVARPLVKQRAPYAPAPSTVAAFLYVAALDDVARLKTWLDDHRRDAPILLEPLESKLC
ncbi:hypothetical protein [Bradyrhizobium sp. AZCC 2230]|uniref:hypothetical protein n=1 Tax=Bradyrhizobium sp. AZCC 2230 TaxID=3117021 RepID=UPI002FF24CCE